MITISFIGSDKNAGKTTVFNHIYQLYAKISPYPVCVTSTGISGEAFDAFYGHEKPSVVLLKNSYFINAAAHMEKKKETYEVIHQFSSKLFGKTYILGKCLEDTQGILEGPNQKKACLVMKEELKKHIDNAVFFIDGSCDRQFVAHPDISDSLFYSVLISPQKDAQRRTRDLLMPLNIPPAEGDIKEAIREIKDTKIKSVLFNEKKEIIYKGETVPFLDPHLKKACETNKKKDSVLYLNGALSKSLFSFFEDHKKLKIVLDNFTLYQNVGEGLSRETFPLNLFLYRPPDVSGIFIIEAPGTKRASSGLKFPENLPVFNLFKEEEKASAFLSNFIETRLLEV